MTESMRGSCQCGSVPYQTSEPPLFCLVCHCKDCQKLSAAAFSPTVVFRADAFSVRGKLARYETKSDSGKTKHGYFCPKCGNRIYHLDRGYERVEEKLAACGAEIERVWD